MAPLAAMVKTPTFAISLELAHASRNPRRLLSHKGFTLIELLVVIAIAALLIAVVPTAMDKLREASQYRDTVRAMVLDLRHAHQLATAYGKPVVFQVDLAQRQFGIAGQAVKEIPASLEVKTTVGGSDSSQSDQPASITFLPQGGSTGGTVELVRQSGAGVRIRVDWLMGQTTQEPRLP